MPRLSLIAVVGLSLVAGDLEAARPDRVFAEGKSPPDSRLGVTRKLRDKYHPWVAPKTLKEWDAESARVRRQLEVATGLWPAWLHRLSGWCVVGVLRTAAKLGDT